VLYWASPCGVRQNIIGICCAADTRCNLYFKTSTSRRALANTYPFMFVSCARVHTCSCSYVIPDAETRVANMQLSQEHKFGFDPEMCRDGLLKKHTRGTAWNRVMLCYSPVESS